jgi:hypothetical protein
LQKTFLTDRDFQSYSIAHHYVHTDDASF